MKRHVSGRILKFHLGCQGADVPQSGPRIQSGRVTEMSFQRQGSETRRTTDKQCSLKTEQQPHQEKLLFPRKRPYNRQHPTQQDRCGATLTVILSFSFLMRVLIRDFFFARTLQLYQICGRQVVCPVEYLCHTDTPGLSHSLVPTITLSVIGYKEKFHIQSGKDGASGFPPI